MSTLSRKKAIPLLEDVFQELESSKGSILTGIQKLYRSAQFLEDFDIKTWCEIQLGDLHYTLPLNEYIETIIDCQKNNPEDGENKIKEKEAQLIELGLKSGIHYTTEELAVKASKAGGGYLNIEFIEKKYLDLIRAGSDNDGTYYKADLNRHLIYARKAAHRKAIRLYHRHAIKSAPETNFDVFKEAVDDRLLDVHPELSEELMAAFKSVSSENPKEWAQALASCRRLIEKLADALYPAGKEKEKDIAENQCVNRLSAFIDEAIGNKEQSELAKAHVDYIGSYLQKLYETGGKSAHTDLTRAKALNLVFQTYLLIGDIIDYLDVEPKNSKMQKNIHTASLDELESKLGITHKVAKEIVKLRAQNGLIDEHSLSCIKGVGPKTVEKTKKIFSLKPVAK